MDEVVLWVAIHEHDMLMVGVEQILSYTENYTRQSFIVYCLIFRLVTRRGGP
jgi:hypothetical protein